MAGNLQEKRTNTAALQLLTLLIGQLYLDTDSNQLTVGDGATAAGILVGGRRRNTQTGTTYTVLNTDAGKLITFNNAAAVAVTLAQAGSSSGGFFPAQYYFEALNLGAGSVVITPTTSTINGGSSITLNTGDSAFVVSDGTDYFALISRATSAIPTLAIVTKTSNYVILASDSGKRFNINGAIGDVDFSLPSAAVGFNLGFAVTAAQYLKIIADGTDVISWGTTDSAAGGYMRSNAPFSFLTIECHSTGQWIVSSSEGDWSVDA